MHPPFYRQETDKHVLAYNKYNSFPLFENRYGDGNYESASYRSGPFEKYKDARVPGVEVTNEYTVWGQNKAGQNKAHFLIFSEMPK